MYFWEKKPQVIVVGAGPVGLFAALLLARKGIRVQIVDREWRTGAHSYALALHQSSLKLLEEAGLREQVLADAYRVRTVAFYDASTRLAALPLHDLEEDFSFVSVLRQEALEELLEKALADQGVKVEWNHEASELQVFDDHVELRIDRLEGESRGYGVAHTEKVIGRSKRFDVPFVIGADGYGSDVRHSLGIDFPSVGPVQPFAVFEFRTDADLGNEVRIVIENGTRSVLWPMPDGFCRWSFELDPRDIRAMTREKDRFSGEIGIDRYQALEVAHLEALLTERASWFDGSIDQIVWRKIVQFERHVASSFGRGRVWLAGDAGHVTGPVGMQSMNIGLREASELANILASILNEDAPMSLLGRYGDHRVAEWRALLGLDEPPEVEQGAEPWVVEHRDCLLECLPASGGDLENLARHLGLKPKLVVPSIA